LRQEKMDPEVRLLSKLEELQKAWDEVFDLQKKVTSVQLEISSLREQIEKERVEKLVLKHKVRALENSEHR